MVLRKCYFYERQLSFGKRNIKPLCLDFCPHKVSNKVEKLLKYQILAPFEACNVLQQRCIWFLLQYLWIKWLRQLIFQHFINFVPLIVTHNMRDKSLSEELNIPSSSTQPKIHMYLMNAEWSPTYQGFSYT